MKAPTWLLRCPDSSRWQARLLARREVSEGGCWIWQGPVDHGGYGRFRWKAEGVRRETGAHRAAWLAFRGNLAESEVIDHLCRTPRCFNPDHLDHVTNSANALRGLTGFTSLGCTEHGFAASGRYYTSPRTGHRRWICRPCEQRRTRTWRARQSA